MNLIKRCVAKVAIAAVIITMAALQSCSDSKKASELLECVGDDAQVVMLFRPVDLLRSLDAKKDGDDVVFPSWVKRSGIENTFELGSLKGIDIDLVAFAVYGRDYDWTEAFIVKVTDEDDFVTSLTKMDYTKDRQGKRTMLYKEPESEYGGEFTGDYMVVLIDGDYAWAGQFYAWCDSRSDFESKVAKDAELVENVIGAAKHPLKDWKVEQLMAHADKAFSGIGIVDERQYTGAFVWGVDLDGSKANAEVRCFSDKGKEQEWWPDFKFKTIGSEAGYLSADDMLAVAFGGFDGGLMDAVEAISPYDARDMKNTANQFDAEDLFDSLSGGFVLGANADNVSSSRIIESLKGWQVSLGIGFTNTRASAYLSQAMSTLKDAGLDIHGSNPYSLRLDEIGSIDASAEGNMIILSTGDKSPNKPLSVSSVDDCIGFASVNIPADFYYFRQAKIDYGFKGKAYVYPTYATAEFEFDGADMNFLDAFGEMCYKLSKINLR